MSEVTVDVEAGAGGMVGDCVKVEIGTDSSSSPSASELVVVAVVVLGSGGGSEMGASFSVGGRRMGVLRPGGMLVSDDCACTSAKAITARSKSTLQWFLIVCCLQTLPTIPVMLSMTPAGQSAFSQTCLHD